MLKKLSNVNHFHPQWHSQVRQLLSRIGCSSCFRCRRHCKRWKTPGARPGLAGWASCHSAPGILMYLGYLFEGNQSMFFLISEEMMKLVDICFFFPLKKLMNLGRKPFPMTTTSPRDIQKHRLVFLMLGLDPTSQLNASIYSPRWMNFWRPQTFARPTCKRDLTKIMRCLMVDDRWWPTFPTIQKTSKEMDYKKWWITCNN